MTENREIHRYGPPESGKTADGLAPFVEQMIRHTHPHGELVVEQTKRESKTKLTKTPAKLVVEQTTKETITKLTKKPAAVARPRAYQYTAAERDECYRRRIDHYNAEERALEARVAKLRREQSLFARVAKHFASLRNNGPFAYVATLQPACQLCVALVSVSILLQLGVWFVYRTHPNALYHLPLLYMRPNVWQGRDALLNRPVPSYMPAIAAAVRQQEVTDMESTWMLSINEQRMLDLEKMEARWHVEEHAMLNPSVLTLPPAPNILLLKPTAPGPDQWKEYDARRKREQQL